MTQDRQEADVAFIEALAKLLRDNDLTELEVHRAFAENDSLNVRVSRAQGGVPDNLLPLLTALRGSETVAVSAPATPAPQPVAAPAAAASTEDPADLPGAVTSPMVGTVYLQAEPGAPPFVKVGDTVSEGQTIMIVEAMKTMNQIPAPSSGTIKRILVADGDPVEFGAPLMVIE